MPTGSWNFSVREGVAPLGSSNCTEWSVSHPDPELSTTVPTVALKRAGSEILRRKNVLPTEGIELRNV